VVELSKILEEAYNGIGWEMEQDENWVFNKQNWRIG
jgi:hypothetical protein